MQVLINKIAEIIKDAGLIINELETICECSACTEHRKTAALAIIDKLTINDLELIINDKRYEAKAQAMREADARD